MSNETSVKANVSESCRSLTSLGTRGTWKAISVAVLLKTSCAEDSWKDGPYPGTSTQRGWRELMAELGSLTYTLGLGRNVGIGWEGRLEMARVHLHPHTCVLNGCTNQPLGEGPRVWDVSQGWDCGASGMASV